MERLTFEGNFCDIAMCRENPCPYNGTCSQKETNEYVILDDELRSILFAKNEGRLVVLPCKVGDTVYVVEHDEAGDFVDDYEVIYFYISSTGVNRIYASSGTAHKNFRPKDFGKTVFLTREEAEAALKGEGNG